jgi:hypothetical protein
MKPAPIIEFLVRLVSNARHRCDRGTERDMSRSLAAAAPLLRNRRSGVRASLRLHGFLEEIHPGFKTRGRGSGILAPCFEPH